ncbi:MAG TPA: FAD-dependent oxidoreductase [Modicisalibacter sp.]|nr:FAD-dependent oxidoreductase [Modicisalibacter sp.]
MEAIWKIASVEGANYPPLEGSVETDVVVIGAGITGLTTALQLAEAGSRVTVLEALRVGEGCTGGSTGNLYSTLANGLASIRDTWSDDVVNDVITSRSQAIDHIEATSERFGIDCEFRRQPLYRIVTSDDHASVRALEKEQDTMRGAGLTASVINEESLSIPVPVHQGLKLDNQAQFNPLRYVQGLAQAVSGLGVLIHEHSPVREVDYAHGVVKTDAAEVTARHIVHATHTPKGINMLQTGMVPSREYAVSAKLNGSPYPEGIFWMLDPFHSLRSYRHNDEAYFGAIGHCERWQRHRDSNR